MGAQPFSLDYKAAGEHILCAPWMVAEMERLAKQAQARAEELAPVDEKSAHSGRYKASFHVTSGIRTGRRPRAYGELYNDAPEALFVEFGTKTNPRRRVLGTAVGFV